MPLKIFTDRERLDHLRRRLAAAERVSVVQRVQADVNVFSEGVNEGLLCDVADLQDRCAAKAERLGGAPAPKQSRKVALLLLLPRPSGGPPAPAIEMVIGPWTVDAEGVRGRQIWNRQDGMSPPP